eukprot:5261256-Pleurochrysis_carterae.AAC.2
MEVRLGQAEALDESVGNHPLQLCRAAHVDLHTRTDGEVGENVSADSVSEDGGIDAPLFALACQQRHVLKLWQPLAHRPELGVEDELLVSACSVQQDDGRQLQPPPQRLRSERAQQRHERCDADATGDEEKARGVALRVANDEIALDGRKGDERSRVSRRAELIKHPWGDTAAVPPLHRELELSGWRVARGYSRRDCP